MSEMVERVGKHLWHALISKGGPGRTLLPWPQCPERNWCIATARELISAMHEPTEAMLEAGQNVTFVSLAYDPADEAEIYQAMIGAALEDSAPA